MELSLQGMNPKLRHKLLTTTTTHAMNEPVGPTTVATLHHGHEILQVTGTDEFGNTTTTNVVVVGRSSQEVCDEDGEIVHHHELVGQVVELGEVEEEQVHLVEEIEQQEEMIVEEVEHDMDGTKEEPMLLLAVDQKPSIVTVTPADLLAPTFPCPHCPRLFNRRNMVTRHINEIHKVALPFKCDLCDKTFSVIPSLQKHLMNYHDVDPEPYKCEECKDTFTLQKLLEEHPCKSRHVKIIPLKRLTKTKVPKKPPPPKQKPTFTCKICRRDFRAKSTLKRHISTHFKCGYCRKSVSSADNLTKHLRTHECDVEEEEKEFVCGDCGKRYYVEENFEMHRVWHREEVEGVKKFGCGNCDQRWKSEDKFKCHLERCRGKSWECEVENGCGKVFPKKGDWERHNRRSCSGTSAKDDNEGGDGDGEEETIMEEVDHIAVGEESGGETVISIMGEEIQGEQSDNDHQDAKGLTTTGTVVNDEIKG